MIVCLIRYQRSFIIKSANNNEVFVLDVEGEPYNEVLTIKDFNVNDFESEVDTVIYI